MSSAALRSAPGTWRAVEPLGVGDEFALRTALVTMETARANVAPGIPIPSIEASGVRYQLDPKGCNAPVPWWRAMQRGAASCQSLTAWELAREYQRTGQWPAARLEPSGAPGLIHVRPEASDPAERLMVLGRASTGRIEPDDWCAVPSDVSAEAGAVQAAPLGALLGVLAKGLDIASTAIQGGRADRPAADRQAPPAQRQAPPAPASSGQAPASQPPTRELLGLLAVLTDEVIAMRGELPEGDDDEAGAGELPEWKRPELLHPALRDALAEHGAATGVYLVSGYRDPERQILLWENRMVDARKVGQDAPASWEDVEYDWPRWWGWVQAEKTGRAAPRGGAERPAQLAPPGLSRHQSMPATAMDLGGNVEAFAKATSDTLHRPVPGEPWHFEPKRP